MHEIPKPVYELSPDGLRKRLEDLTGSFEQYTKASTIYQNAIALYLNSVRGERIIILLSSPGDQPAGQFFQDLNMKVLAGSNPNFGVDQIDYNFNQYCDGQLRKRVISGKENKAYKPPHDATDKEIANFASLSLFYAREAEANRALEEQFGLNNTASTTDDITEAMNFLDGASVLDPNNGFRPVAVVLSN